MLNKKHLGMVAITVGLMLFFSFAGCDLADTSPEGGEPQGVIFSLNLPQSSYLNSANNLITQTYSYRLIVEKDNAEVHNQEYLASEEKITLELSTGLHYFTLQAFNDEGIMLGEGSASGNLVIGMNQVKITLIPVGVYVEIEVEWGERPGEKAPLGMVWIEGGTFERDIFWEEGENYELKKITVNVTVSG